MKSCSPPSPNNWLRTGARQRQGRRGARYLLQGLLTCECCGYAYYGKQISLRSGKGKKRRYAYYRCTGTDAYRFGGQGVCHNKQVRTDLLEEAVWADVCALLKNPSRIEAEYERRLHNKDSDKESKGGRQLEVLIQKVKRGIARLIDAYGEGLVNKEEFEPRVRAFRERLARLEVEAQQQQELEAQERELRLVIGRVQEFAERVKAGLEEADWSTQREIIRALVKRVEIGVVEVRVVYRVNLAPFAESPRGGILPDCWRRAFSRPGEPSPGWNTAAVDGTLRRDAQPGARSARSIWLDMRMTVRQAMSVRDEGRSLGAGLRRQAPNHLERLGSRAPVVSVKEKARRDCVRCGSERRTRVNHR